MKNINTRRYRLIISCPDQVGIVAAVSSFLADHNGWILEANHHSDASANWFFMRQEIRADSLPFDIDEFRSLFSEIADQYKMNWYISDSEVPKKVVLLVSNEEHCLADLLYRWRTKEYDFEVTAVISNHDRLRSYVEWHNIPYYHIPVKNGDKALHFKQVEEKIEQHQADVVVLARYMQILPANICHKYEGKIINIHHSFLPSFAGAKPYHQAYNRGVKLIGATCHYVTADLDAGPIIEQNVMRITHEDNVEKMKRLGRDAEKATLARGLFYHLEDRVIVHNDKTIVFP